MSERISTIPGVAIRIGSRRMTRAGLESLVRIRVRRELGVPAQCELTCLDPPPDVDLLASEPGADLQVALEGHDAPLFVGEVTALELAYGPDGRHVFRVRGYDRLHRLRKRVRLRAHVRVTAEALAGDLGSDLGLSVQAAWSGPEWAHLIQHHQSDLDLLVDVAERAGLHPVLEGSTLCLDGLRGRGAPIPLERGRTLLEATFEINGELACRSVTAHGWDPLVAGYRQATARSPSLGRAVEAEAAPGQVHADRERHVLNVTAPTEEHAASVARAELDRRAATEVVVRGLAAGNPWLAPGRAVEVRGVHSSIAGRYVLTAITHHVDAERGFVTDFSTEPPPRCFRAGDERTTLGIVTQVADPDARGRVRVRLPTYGDVETDWMRVAAAGAGRSKGLVAVPDVGDEVLVLFSRDDPAHGIVLAGLFGEAGPEDPGVVGDAVKRFSLASGGGHRIVLDEEKGTLCIETGQGSRIEMGRNRMLLHAATDLVVEAPGRNLLFRAATVDFERAR